MVRASADGAYEELCVRLRAAPRSWLVTGAAGFIGSHLVQRLLELDQRVVGLDDLSTGREDNLVQLRGEAGEAAWGRFRLQRADLLDEDACATACRGVELVLHQAALGSVPRSIADPLRTQEVNVGGSLRLFQAAQEAGVERVVYASSSSVYGDSAQLPKREELLGRPLSPYAASKRAVELFAASLRATRGAQLVGLRYFNVVGARQRPDGPYAAVLPRWLAQLAEGRAPLIYGDGSSSRDFTPVENVVRANLLAACAPHPGAIYNVATGSATRLDRLARALIEGGVAAGVLGSRLEPRHEPPRTGDVAHSLADISRAERELGYRVAQRLEEELEVRIRALVGRRRGASGAPG